MLGAVPTEGAADAAGAGLAERSSLAFLFHFARFGAALRLTIRSPFFSLAASRMVRQAQTRGYCARNAPSRGMAAAGIAGAGVVGSPGAATAGAVDEAEVSALEAGGKAFVVEDGVPVGTALIGLIEIGAAAPFGGKAAGAAGAAGAETAEGSAGAGSVGAGAGAVGADSDTDASSLVEGAGAS